MRDNEKTFIALRPNAKFIDNCVNCYSLETIGRSYIGEDMPTEEEMNAKWEEIKNDPIQRKITPADWLDAMIAREKGDATKIAELKTKK